jgi:hypothetical protein
MAIVDHGVQGGASATDAPTMLIDRAIRVVMTDSIAVVKVMVTIGGGR